MKFIKEKTNDPYQHFKAFPATDEEIEAGLKDGTLKAIDDLVYLRLDKTEYQTKVMTPQKKVATAAKKKTTTKRKPGRPRKRAAAK